MPKSRDAASRASDSIAGEGSGISVVFSSPSCRIVIANWATGAARAVGCDTFCSWTCAMPPEHGVGIVLPLTSGVWCEPLDKIIRRKLMPSLEHVTWSDPTVTCSRLGNLVAADSFRHKRLNLLYSLRGKFYASAPNGGAGVRHRHDCPLRGPECTVCD